MGRPSKYCSMILPVAFWFSLLNAQTVSVRLPVSDVDQSRYYASVSTTDPCNSISGWTVQSNSQTVAASIVTTTGRTSGGTGLSISGEWVGLSLEYVKLTPPSTSWSDPDYVVGVWARFVSGKHPLTVRLRDTTGEIFQYRMISTFDTDWSFYVMDAGNLSGNWGGDADGVIDYPVSLDSVLIDRPYVGFTGSNEICLDDLLVLDPDLTPLVSCPISVRVPTGKVGHLYDPNETVELTLAETNGAARTVNWNLLDFDGQSLQTGAVSLVANGSATLSFTPPGSGHYRCVLSVLAGGNLEDAYDFNLAVVPSYTDPEATVPFAGGCAHYILNSWPLDAIPLSQKLGAQLQRFDFVWSSVETTLGVYTIPAKLDSAVSDAAGLGIETSGILCYGNPLYGGASYSQGCYPTNATQRQAFANYSKAIVNHYKNTSGGLDVKYYEVWNEWTGGCGMRDEDGNTLPGNTDANYVELLKTTYPAIKSVSSAAKVIGLGGANPRVYMNSISNMCTLGMLNYCDVISLHPYRHPRAPEEPSDSGKTMVEEIQSVIDIMNQYDSNERVGIWISEISWPVGSMSGGVSEKEQAQYLARSFVLLKSLPRIENITWYDLKNDGTDPAVDQENFALIRHQDYNYAPKSAAVSFGVVSRLLADAQFVQRQESEDHVYRYEFLLPDGSTLLAAWTSHGTSQEHFACSGSVSVTDLMGRVEVHGSAAAGLDLMLSESPLFIQSMNPDLVYRMDSVANGVLTNETTSGLNATYHGTVLVKQGMVDSALSMDGSANYASVPSVDPGNEFSVSLWMKLSSAATGLKGLWGNTVWGGTQNGFKLFVYADSADRYLRLETGNGTLGDYAQTTSQVITAGVWHHVAAVVNRTAGTAALYVDGTNQTSDSSVRTDFLKESVSGIGAINSIGYGKFPGELDDVRIYFNRSLSAEDVYALSRNLPCNRYRFESLANSVVVNETGPELNAVLSGGSLESAGVSGSAIRFSGAAGQYVNGINLPHVDTRVSKSCSVMFWAKLDASASGKNTVWANAGLGNADGCKVFLEASSTNRLVRVETGNGTLGQAAYTVPGVLESGWNHVAVLFDREHGLVTIYVNGVNQTSKYTVRSDFKVSGPYFIGSMSDGGLRLTGCVDELTVYDHLITEAYVMDSYLMEHP